VVSDLARWLRDEEANAKESSVGDAHCRVIARALFPVRSRRSAGISDGSRDGNDGSRQRPDAAVNSHVLSHIQSELDQLHLKTDDQR
jgi:hypothetical protein